MSLPTLAIALLCAGIMGLLTLSLVAAAPPVVSGPTAVEKPEGTATDEIIATYT